MKLKMGFMGIGGVFIGMGLQFLISFIKLYYSHEVNPVTYFSVVLPLILRIYLPCVVVGIALVIIAMVYKMKGSMQMPNKDKV